jgi:hypothetical protein
MVPPVLLLEAKFRLACCSSHARLPEGHDNTENIMLFCTLNPISADHKIDMVESCPLSIKTFSCRQDLVWSVQFACPQWQYLDCMVYCTINVNDGPKIQAKMLQFATGYF